MPVRNPIASPRPQAEPRRNKPGQEFLLSALGLTVEIYLADPAHNRADLIEQLHRLTRLVENMAEPVTPPTPPPTRPNN